jgi:hypoxanthine phosphoribosyltransferase
MKIKDKEFRIFIQQEKIEKRVKELAREISRDYLGKDPLIIPVLNGAFLFASDLIKEINVPCQLTFVKASSYSGTESTGNLCRIIGLDMDLRSRHVILIDDIVDTGLTMKSIFEEVRSMNPSSIEVATLLLKPEAMQKEIEVKYVGFTIPNNFVVGYGLDYEGYGRNLKDIYQISKDC